MAIEKTINLNVDSKKATKGLKDLEKGIDGVNKEVQETSKSTQEMSGTIDQVSGGAVTKFNKFKGAIGSVTTGFKSLRVAIIGTGIGALLIAVTALGQAFTRSEEGQNKFSKILGVIGSVTGNLLDLLADLGENIISVFENPKQALIDFKNLIVENITNRFEAIIDTLGFLGSAFKKVFSGDFSGALEDAKKAGSSYIDSVTGVKNSIDKASESVKNFTKEIVDDANAAAKIADQRANAEKKARDLIVERAEAERQIADLRAKAVDKEKFTAQERVKFLEEAGRVSDELAAKEVQVAKLRLEAKKTENELTKSNKDDLKEAAELEANVIQLETQRLNLQKSLSKELLNSRREVTAEEKANLKELDDLKKTLRDAEAVSEQEKRELELIKIQEHFDNLIAQADENNILTDELEAARDEAKRLKQEEFDLKDAERKQKILEEDKKIADSEIALEQQKTAAKRKALDDAISLAGAETGVGKALLIVKQGLALKEMIMEAKKTITFSKLAVAKSTVAAAEGTAQTAKIGFPQNIPMLIGYAAQAVGIIGAIRSATSSANSISGSFGGGGGASVPAAAPSIPTAASIPPSFNVVGASETSVLGDAVASQSNEPIQAYVVSNDITTAQSLENNIVEGATI